MYNNEAPKISGKNLVTEMPESTLVDLNERFIKSERETIDYR